jgi:hypothetical protein
MGASTTAQLITKGRAENGYNNSGISGNSQWVDFFNDALRDLVEDLCIEQTGTITFVTTTREYDLPDDYYAINIMNDGSRSRVSKRRNYDADWPEGYWIFNRGGNYVIDLYNFMSAQTFTFTYQAYAPELVLGNITTEKPSVPSVGEKALIYYAIAKALSNNNQLGQADFYYKLYEAERKKLRNAVARGVN